MKVLILNSEEIKFQREGADDVIILKRNVPYVIPDYIVDKIREQEKAEPTKGPLIHRAKELYNYYKKYQGENLNGMNIVILRTGGIGDLIFITPCAKYLRKKYPEAKIFLACATSLVPLFKGLSCYDDVFSIPLDVNSTIGSIGYPISPNNTFFMSFEGIIETSKDAERYNVYDLHRRTFGIKEEIEYRPEIFVEPEIFERVKKEHFISEGRLAIGFQMSASSAIRTWKPRNIVQYLNEWKIDNTDFYIFDSPSRLDFVTRYLSKIKNSKIRIINIPKLGLKIKESAALISFLQLMITPDSSLAHIAGCYNVPLIGLFGAFPSILRIAFYKDAYGLDVMSNCQYAHGEMKACFQHGNTCALAQEVNRTFSPCMDLLTPQLVAGYTYGIMERLKLIPKGVV